MNLKINWQLNDGVHGFTLEFLERKARNMAERGNWVAFNALLVVMIYGIVLFQNNKEFVDFAVMCVFMTKNLISTLLEDTYYGIHSRHKKKGIVNIYLLCCIDGSGFIFPQKGNLWTLRTLFLG